MADRFAQQLAAALGLDSRVTQAWHRAENGPADNPLNLGPGGHYADPLGATVNFLSSGDKAGYYKGILAAKGNPAGQVAAIKASPFDSSHYANGVLDRTAAEYGITSRGGRGAGSAPVSTPAVRSSMADAGSRTNMQTGLSPRSQLGLALAQQIGKPQDLGAFTRTLLDYHQRQAGASSSSQPTAAAAPAAPMRQGAVSPPTGMPTEAFYDPLGSYDNGQFGGPIGNHMDHVHISETNPQQMLAAIQLAQSMGLRVGENPYTDPVDGNHVSGSFHYKTFPGQYNGRRLGEAIDVTGPAASMANFYRAMVPGGPKG